MQRYTTRDYNSQDYNDRGRGYDRDYDRGFSSDYGSRDTARGYGSRVYGGDRGYDGDRGYNRDYAMSDEGYGRGDSGMSRDYGRSRRSDRDYDRGDYRREYDRSDRDRGFMDRAGDEVRSWFGDDDAQRRRRYDERYDRDYGRGGYESSYQGRSTDYGTSPRYGTGVVGNDYRMDRGYDRGDSYGQGSYGSRGRYDRGYQQDQGHRQTESHAGKGPKGYERSSDRTVEEVSERLMWHGELDPSNIQVTAENSEVTLEGTVESRRAKRMAEDLAESATGVRDVHNRLRVQRRSAGDENDTETGSSTSAAKSKKSS